MVYVVRNVTKTWKPSKFHILVLHESQRHCAVIALDENFSLRPRITGR